MSCRIFLSSLFSYLFLLKLCGELEEEGEAAGSASFPTDVAKLGIDLVQVGSEL
jgi:hypothetical protein